MEILTHLVSLKYCLMVKKVTLDIQTLNYVATSLMIKVYSNGMLHFYPDSFKMELTFNLNLVTTVDILSLFDKIIGFSSTMFLRIFWNNILIL